MKERERESRETERETETEREIKRDKETERDRERVLNEMQIKKIFARNICLIVPVYTKKLLLLSMTVVQY